MINIQQPSYVSFTILHVNPTQPTTDRIQNAFVRDNNALLKLVAGFVANSTKESEDIKIIDVVVNPYAYNFRPHVRSLVAGGDEFHQITEKETVNWYCPTNEDCGLKCINWVCKQIGKEDLLPLYAEEYRAM